MHASQGVDTRADEQNVLFVEDAAINVGEADGITRTQMGEVGDGAENSTQPIRWSDNDKFLAWAAPVGTGGESSTNYADGFNAVTFSLDHYNYTFSSADFAATLSKPMAAQNTFDYYAVYPVPSSVSGTQVSFNLSATQSGDFNSAWDVMRASARGNALVGRNPNQMSTPVWPEPMLPFEHIMHVLRIYVPANRNLMLREISRLEITFPDNVVGGTVSFDAARPDVAPAWSGQTNKVTIQMDNNPLNASGRYVWVFIKPGVMSGDVKFRAYNLLGEPSQMISTTLSNHNFQAQHITPFTLTIPKVLTPVTITFKCPDNTSYPNFLGEAPNAMYVKEWPAGIVAVGESDNVVNALDGTFVAKFYYEAGELNTELPGKTIRVGFASKSADVSHNEVTMTIPSTLSTGGNYTLNFALPYLFYEDFKNVGSMENKFGGTDNKYYTNDTYSLDDYLPDAGWTGNQITSTANTNITLKCRHEGTGIAYGDYSSRVDSAPITALTSASNISIYFDYACTIDGSVQNNYKAYLRYGGTTTAGPIEAFYRQAGAEYNSKVEGNTLTVAEGKNTFRSGNTAYQINAAAQSQRLSWNIYAEGRSDGGVKYLNYNLALDNIKVSVGSVAKHTGEDYRTFFPNHQN